VAHYGLERELGAPELDVLPLVVLVVEVVGQRLRLEVVEHLVAHRPLPVQVLGRRRDLHWLLQQHLGRLVILVVDRQEVRLLAGVRPICHAGLFRLPTAHCHGHAPPVVRFQRGGERDTTTPRETTQIDEKNPTIYECSARRPLPANKRIELPPTSLQREFLQQFYCNICNSSYCNSSLGARVLK
jgi:hypothetical protein